MGQDKKQLTQLLAFVKKLYDHPDNREFAQGIREMVLGDRDFLEQLRAVTPSDDQQALKRIEKYLSLDFEIDDKIFPDYSAIEDDGVRSRLQADFREMLRCRYGTRNHRVDFPEFCRFAHMQAEMLVNYYFEKKFGGDIAKVVKAIQGYNPGYNPYQGLKDVSGIPFKTKLFHLRNEFSWPGSIINTYLYTTEVRNKQSHRSLKADKDLIRDTEEKLKAAGAWNAAAGIPSYEKDAEGNSIAANIVGKDTLNEYNFQVWYDRQPFDSITKGLKSLADKVASSL